jgi:hypothetical protein
MSLENEQTESIFGGEDFVVMEKRRGDGEMEYMSGGYKINSFFLKAGMPALTTFNNEEQKGGKVSSPFENLAVPAGLFYINQRIPKNADFKQDVHYKEHDTISDDMIDKLFGLVEANKKQKRKTRKHIIKQDKRKSRKHN